MKKNARVSRRALLTAGGAVAAAYALRGVKPAHAGLSSLRFLAVGDWGAPFRKGQQDVARAMGIVGEETDIHFVLSLGDNFYPHGVESVTDPHWRETFENVYSARSLMCPWHVVLGNHDHEGNVDAQIAYSGLSDRWRLPARYYKRTEMLADGSAAEFYFLDTDPIRLWRKGLLRHINFVPDGQLQWLDSELSRSRARWKIVIGHHPVFAGGKHGPTWPLVDHLKPVLERHGVQVYLCGHNHDQEHIVWNGVNYLVSGAGSHPHRVDHAPGTKFASEGLGFMAASLNPDEMMVTFYNEAARPLHRTLIPAEASAVS